MLRITTDRQKICNFVSQYVTIHSDNDQLVTIIWREPKSLNPLI